MGKTQFIDLTDPNVTSWAYIGRAPGCGCIRGACVDDPCSAERTARWVKDFIGSGLTVERVDSRLVKVQFGRCDQCDPPKPAQEALPL